MKRKTFNDFYEFVKENYPNLNEFQSLQIAAQLQRNYILEVGLGVDNAGKPALEFIGMQLMDL